MKHYYTSRKLGILTRYIIDIHIRKQAATGVDGQGRCDAVKLRPSREAMSQVTEPSFVTNDLHEIQSIVVYSVDVRRPGGIRLTWWPRIDL